MQGRGERMVEDQGGLVLILGMSLAWAPGKLCIHSRSKGKGQERRKTLHKSTHQVPVPGGVPITPAKRVPVRIVVKDHACLELHGLPTTYLNSIKAVAKLINRQTDSQLINP